jgi:hypothetical protein
MDISKYYLQLSEMMFLAAMDPDRAVKLIREKEKEIDGMDTLIVRENTSSYFANVAGESQNVIVERLTTDSVTNKLTVELVEGPKSWKSIPLGDRSLNLFELKNFRVKAIDRRTESPLTTRYTIGQFHPPNPRIGPNDPIISTNSAQLDRGIYVQTKTSGLTKPFGLSELLENTGYWDVETGGPSADTLDLVGAYNKRLKQRKELVPWDWNPANPEYVRNGKHGDINRELGSNDKPNMQQINGKQTLAEMRGFREEHPGLTFVPKIGEYRFATRIGDLHKRSFPPEWGLQTVRKLARAAIGTTDFSEVDELYQELDAFLDELDDAPWDTYFLQELIDTNVGRMVSANNFSAKGLKTSKTPQRAAYPNAAQLEEFLPNRFGGLELPQISDIAVRPVIPPGMRSAEGILTLAQHGTNDRSQYYAVGLRAKRFVDFFRSLQKTIEENASAENDTLDGELLPPWVHKGTSLNAMLNGYIHPAGPVFLGVPEAVAGSRDINGGVGGGGGNAGARLAPELILKDGEGLLAPTVVETKVNIAGLMQEGEKNVLVNNKERFLSCLVEPVYAKWFNMVVRKNNAGQNGIEQNFPEASDMQKILPALHTLYDKVVVMCKYNTTVVGTTVAAASMVADEVADILDSAVKAMPAQRTAESTAAAASALQTQLVALVKDIFESNNSVRLNEIKKAHVGNSKGDFFARELKAYELQQAQRVPYSRGANADALSHVPTGAQEQQARFRGTYPDNPQLFLRSPIVITRALASYIDNTDGAKLYILPGDPGQFYETPAEPQMIHTIEKHPFELRGSVFQLAAKRVVQSALRSKGGSSSGGRGNMDNDLFSSLRSPAPTMSLKKTTHRQTGFGNLMQFGQGYDDEDNSGVSFRRAPQKMQVDDQEGDISVKTYKDVLTDEYFGPWESRFAWADKNIKSPLLRHLYKMLMQSRNTLQLAQNMARLGAEIFQVIVVRQFIEGEADAVLALRSGHNTLISTIGHSQVTVSKESRGYFHINCGFFHGIVRSNPRNIALFVAMMPNSFIGGKNDRFMNDMNNWNLDNPNKESNIAVLIPVNERRYASPMHVLNNEAFLAADIGDALWERKSSGFGFSYKHRLRMQNLEQVDSLHQQREFFDMCVPYSNVVNAGPTSYTQADGSIFDMDGTGPTGSMRMNKQDAYRTWEGQSHAFPPLYHQINAY